MTDYALFKPDIITRIYSSYDFAETVSQQDFLMLIDKITNKDILDNDFILNECMKCLIVTNDNILTLDTFINIIKNKRKDLTPFIFKIIDYHLCDEKLVKKYMSLCNNFMFDPNELSYEEQLAIKTYILDSYIGHNYNNRHIFLDIYYDTYLSLPVIDPLFLNDFFEMLLYGYYNKNKNLETFYNKYKNNLNMDFIYKIHRVEPNKYVINNIVLLLNNGLKLNRMTEYQIDLNYYDDNILIDETIIKSCRYHTNPKSLLSFLYRNNNYTPSEDMLNWMKQHNIIYNKETYLPV